MEHIITTIETAFYYIVQISILIPEIAGVVTLLATTIKSILFAIEKKPNVRLTLAQGIALALEFKLGSEVLRTVLVRETQELIILGAIILLRGALTFLIHWEIKTEESRI